MVLILSTAAAPDAAHYPAHMPAQTPARVNPSADQLQRAARQELETSRLLGVPFVPVNVNATGPAPTSDAAAEDQAAALASLREHHDAHCGLCTKVPDITQTVFGEGNPDADLVFVGEAPGAEEDRTGRPFVGRAGQKLDDMIRAMGLDRSDVYIANILKSRPPNNRTPQRDEVDKCAPYLADQLRIIRPAVIVALGGPSTKFLLDTEVGITRLRGRWARYVKDDLAIDVMPTFHPAYLLRNYTPDTRTRVWSDLQAVMDRLRGRS